MRNQLHVNHELTFNFLEKVAILFGRKVIVNCFITTDQPFERANVSSTVLIKNNINHKDWKNKPDLTNEKTGNSD